MPVVLVLAVPAMIAVGVTGYYLIAIAKLVDTALGVANLVDTGLALAIPTDIPTDRRRRFTVIEGGKTTLPKG